MIRRPPRSTRTATLLPYSTLFRSVIGAGLYIAFIQLEISSGMSLAGSTWGLEAAHVLITIPWCVRLITTNLLGVDRSVEEAALSLGARPLTTLFRDRKSTRLNSSH